MNTAACYDIGSALGGVCQLSELLTVDSRKSSVLGNISEYKVLHSCFYHLVRKVDVMYIGAFQPPLGGNHFVHCIYPYNYLLTAELLNGITYQLRIFECNRAEYNSCYAHIQIFTDSPETAYTAAQLDLKICLFGNVRVYLCVDRSALFRSVKVHHVYPLSASRLKALCSFEIVRSHLFNSGKVTLEKADTVTVLNIYRGENYHKSSPF